MAATANVKQMGHDNAEKRISATAVAINGNSSINQWQWRVMTMYMVNAKGAVQYPSEAYSIRNGYSSA